MKDAKQVIVQLEVDHKVPSCSRWTVGISWCALPTVSKWEGRIELENAFVHVPLAAIAALN